MAISLRYVRLGRIGAIVIALLLAARTAGAKPMVLIKVEIDPRDRNLREKLERDLKVMRGEGRTPKQFLTETFRAEVAALGMFDFVTDDVARPDDVLTLFVTSGEDRERYPARDVVVRISLASDTQRIAMPLFRRAGCSTARGVCAPDTLADPTWYQQRLRALLRQWPTGLFKTIVLTSTARYELGGIVRAHEDISEFGQHHAKAPTALFEILYGETQRRFAFCLRVPHGAWNALGRDQGSRTAPDCSVGPSSEASPGDSGQITLFRAFLGEHLGDGWNEDGNTAAQPAYDKRPQP